MSCNSYLKEDLVKKYFKIGKEKGDVKNITEVRKLNKAQLCDKLGLSGPIKKVAKSKATKSSKTKTSKKEGIVKATKTRFINDRLCGPVKSSLNPTAYTKPELVELAITHLDWSKTEASKHNKDEICKELSKAKDIKTSLPKSELTEFMISPKSPKAKSVKKIPKAKTTKKSPKAKTTKKIPKKTTKKSPSPVFKEVAKEGNCIDRSNMSLKEHQRAVVEYMQKHRGLIVVHDVGSGKTLTAVTVSQCYIDSNPKGKVIVVTPTSLQENFKKEMRAYGVNPSNPKYEFYTLQGFASAYKGKKCGKDSLLIIDEAHNLRSDKSKRADVAIECAKTAGKVLLLTATVLYNKPLDIANLAAIVKGDESLTKTEFEKMIEDPSEFNRYFSCITSFYHVKRDENYPSSTEKYVEIQMDPPYYKEYRDVETQQSSYFKESNPFVFLTGIREASNALENCPKCDWIVNKIKEGGKTLVYSAFISYGIKKIQEDLDKLDIKYVEITGKLTPKKRNEAVKAYNSGEVKVFFITKAGGEGLDLKGTRNVIITEAAWNDPNEEQVIGRAIRYKSHTHLPKNQQYVNVYHLIMVKPPINQRDPDDQGKRSKESADVILRDLKRGKSETNKVFLQRLEKLSIENLARCRS